MKKEKKDLYFYRVNTFDGQHLYPTYGQVYDTAAAAYAEACFRQNLADENGYRLNYVVTVEVV